MINTMGIIDTYNEGKVKIIAEREEHKKHAIITSISKFTRLGNDYCATISIAKYGEQYLVYVNINKVVKIIAVAHKVIENVFTHVRELKCVMEDSFLNKEEEQSIIEKVKQKLIAEVGDIFSKAKEAALNEKIEEHAKYLANMMIFSESLWGLA